MNLIKSITLFSLILLFQSCSKEAKNENSDSGQSNDYLIESTELLNLVGQKGYKIIDFRKEQAYAQGHIPGAINIHRKHISSGNYEFNGMRISSDETANLMGKLGLESSEQIIIYDDNGACDASRLWWLLEHYGHKNVKLLNGGWQRWKEVKGAISNDKPKLTSSNYSFPNKPKQLSVAEGNSILLGRPEDEHILLDVRTKGEYDGDYIKKGAFAAGHIPGSINIDWANAVNYNGDMKFKSVKELEVIYITKGITKDKNITIYCHSGVRSSHTYFVLTKLLGYKNVSNYDGSWIEYSFLNLNTESQRIEI